MWKDYDATKVQFASDALAVYNLGFFRDPEVGVDHRSARPCRETVRLSHDRLRRPLLALSSLSSRTTVRHRPANEPGGEGDSGCAWGRRGGVRSRIEEGLHVEC